jgi:translocation and assembly module TamA
MRYGGGASLVKFLFLSLSAAALFAATPAHASEYTVRYDGAPPELRDKLPRLTGLSLRRRTYPTTASIRQAAEADRGAIRRALVAAGYFDPSVRVSIEAPAGDTAPIAVSFDIDPGAHFTIGRHLIVFNDPPSPGRPLTFEEAGIDVGSQSDGATLEQNQRRLLDHLLSKGYPRARIVGRRAEARLAEGAADAVYEFESGPRATFNGVEAVGARNTKSDFIEKMKTWDDGAYINREELAEFRDELSETGLFTSIEVDAGTISANGAAPVRVTLEERKQRTIGAGVSYSTSEGPGGRLFLEYRNIAGRGERARAEVEATEVRQAFDFDIDKPLPRFPGSAFANLSFVNDTTDAFNARSLEIGAGFAKRWLDDRLETRAGLTLETSNVESRLRSAPSGADERTYLFSVPISATWDTEDDPLLLSSGARASLFVIPYTGTDQFTRLELVGRSRRQFGEGDRFTLAARFRIAATAGSALRSLPVNKRIFSGGGSSVRGYDFQAVGPLDADGVPVGGRSAVEAAVEARAKVFGPIQLAAFADAGAVYSDSFPDFVGDYLVGAGGGLRYLTPIGPIRLDVAIPLEKRPTDPGFQFYISLGQPF